MTGPTGTGTTTGGTTTGGGETRVERDQIGEMTLDARDLRGIHTHRAMDNFRLSGRAVHPRLVRAYALVKKACARANAETGWLDPGIAGAIERASDEVASGTHDALFSVDALQGGAGTSTNMALNEVLANRATELLAEAEPSRFPPDGAAAVSPLGHVNLHQSTNDTYPTALKVCLIGLVREAAGAAQALQGAFQDKEKEFARVVTVGRTETLPAVPMTLGAEFSGFAECVGRDRWRAFKCEERLRVVNLGGTAVGTALAAPRRYVFRATDILREITGYPLARAENLVDQTANADALVEVAGIFQAAASNLVKVSRDLRFLAHSGEILLPALQAGSSIMPGKVNPVILEAAIQCGMRMRASLSLVAEAASQGTLQINEYLPLVADAMIESLSLYAAAAETLARHVAGIRADEAACALLLDSNPMTVTAFVPIVGYDGARDLLDGWKADARRLPLRAFLSEKLGGDTVARVLSPAALTSLGFAGEPGAAQLTAPNLTAPQPGAPRREAAPSDKGTTP